jgi:hypothetical protein
MLLDEASQGRPRWEEIVGVAVAVTVIWGVAVTGHYRPPLPLSSVLKPV